MIPDRIRITKNRHGTKWRVSWRDEDDNPVWALAGTWAEAMRRANRIATKRARRAAA